MSESFHVTSTTTEPGEASLRHVTLDSIPAVCTLADLCAIFNLSARSLREMRQRGTFPIPPIPGLGTHVRFSGRVVRDFLETNGIGLPRGRR